jgi:hypothetical protein
MHVRLCSIMLRLSSLAVAALAFCGLVASPAAAAAVKAPPSYGNQLYIKAVMMLPYAGIVRKHCIHDQAT